MTSVPGDHLGGGHVAGRDDRAGGVLAVALMINRPADQNVYRELRRYLADAQELSTRTVRRTRRRSSSATRPTAARS
ncbi:hypothetical protein [Streptomyces tailanensis]|uniref:hypothetical protein n=1 Tax=Streptomyces tailanensis TaxID=2569858 RepID=UPI00319DF22D